MRIAVAAVVALLVGVSSGFLIARSSQPALDLVEELVSCEAGNTGKTLTVLRGLRAGRVDSSILLLETNVSLHAVVLDEWLRELKPADPSKAERFLQAIGEYRAKHPFQLGAPEADRNVEAILARYSSN